MKAQDFYDILSVSNGNWKEDIDGEPRYWTFIEPANNIEGSYMISNGEQVREEEGSFRIDIQDSKAFIDLDTGRYLITFGDTDQEIILKSDDTNRRLSLIRP